MHDQAIKLRSLMRESARPRSCEQLRIVAVSGAKGGVGATTIALSLALAFRRMNLRAALIDFQQGSSSLMEMAPPVDGEAGVDGRVVNVLSDVLADRASWGDALRSSREGILIAGDVWAPDNESVQPIVSDRNVRAKMEELAEHADVAILDLGGRVSRIAASCWALADDIILVTTAETISVMDAYAMVKALCSGSDTAPVNLIVNQATQRQAAAVAKRVNLTCSRFLNLRIHQTLETPVDKSLSESAGAAHPAKRGDALVRAIERLDTLSPSVTTHFHRRPSL